MHRSAFASNVCKLGARATRGTVGCLRREPYTLTPSILYGLNSSCRSYSDTTRMSMAVSTVSASMVKALREKSGAPMMDCKKALASPEVDGDLDKAMDWLRVKGIAKVTSGGSHTSSSEGLIAVKLSAMNGGAGVSDATLLEVNSQTDFLGMNKDFQEFVDRTIRTISSSSGSMNNNSNSSSSSGSVGALGETAVSIGDVLKLKAAPPSTANTAGASLSGEGTLQDALGDIISMIRENIVVRRAAVLSAPTPASSSSGSFGLLAAYVHGKVTNNTLPEDVQMGRVAAVLGVRVDNLPESMNPEEMTRLREATAAMARKLAMHVVAAKPQYLALEDVPSDVIEKETAIFREQSADPKKKPGIIEKIVAGKVSKRLAEICLLEQNHLVEEGNPVVKKFLSGFGAAGLGQKTASVTLTGFTHWQLGQQTENPSEA